MAQAAIKPAADAANKLYESSDLPRTLMRPAKRQPRISVDPQADADLLKSIQEKGVLQPLLVRPLAKPEGIVKYEIVVGESRWRVTEAIRKDYELPVRIRNGDLSTTDQFAIALDENIRRADLSPLEEAEAVRFFLDQGESFERIGTGRFNRSKQWAEERYQLLKLNPDLHWRFLSTTPANQRLSVVTAKKLSTVKDPKLQVQLAEEAAALPNLAAASHIREHVMRTGNTATERPLRAAPAPATSLVIRRMLNSVESIMANAVREKGIGQMAAPSAAEIRASVERIRAQLDSLTGKLPK